MRRLTRQAMLSMSAGAMAGLTLAAPARAQSVRTLKIIVFPGGGGSWPIWVAQRQGFLTKEGLAADITGTPNSVYLIQHLLAGDFDLAHTAIDNIIAYVEGAGEVPVENGGSLAAFMGTDNGVLSMIARPEFKTFGDLRGKRIGVDALSTGFVFVMKRLFAMHGVQPNEYQLVPVGGGAVRYKALAAGEIDGTIINSPFELLAEAAGLTNLGSAIGALGHYQGVSCASTRGWAAKNSDALQGYIRAYVKAMDWLYDPANKSDAIALLAENAKMAPAVAAKSYGVFIDQHGYNAKAAIDPAGLQTVLALRDAYGSVHPLGKPEKYLDLSYYQRALAKT